MFSNILKLIVAASSVTVLCMGAAATANERLAGLLADLRTADAPAAVRLTKEIKLEWEKSGSAAADLLLTRGRKAMQAGDYEIALEHFTALIDHTPEFAEGWVSRASTLVQLGLYGPAIADLEQALKLNPQHFEAINGLGVILELIDKPKAAYQAYLLVTSIHPTHPIVTEALQRLESQAIGQKL